MGQWGAQREWEVSPEVEAQITDIWRDPSSDSRLPVLESARLLLTWRLQQIPNPRRRAQAMEVLQTSLEKTLYRGREYRDMGDFARVAYGLLPHEGLPLLEEFVASEAYRRDPLTALSSLERSRMSLGDLWEFAQIKSLVESMGDIQVSKGRPSVWVHPLERTLPMNIGEVGTLDHEVGGHLAVDDGAQGLLPQWVSRYRRSPVLFFLDPFIPLTHRATKYVDEGWALGAEWEGLHRIPEGQREVLQRALEKELGEKAWLLDVTEADHFDLYMMTHFMRAPFEKHFRVRLAWHANQRLSSASLPKAEFIQAMRIRPRYTWSDIVHEGNPSVFLSWPFNIAKLLAYGGIGVLVHHFLSDPRP